MTGYPYVSDYKSHCRSAGEDLASIHSEDENLFLVSLAYWTWLGGDCSRSPCTCYYAGEPDYQGYVVMGDYGDNEEPELWYDVSRGSDGYRSNTDAVCKI